mgnify:CR=1 FL=1
MAPGNARSAPSATPLAFTPAKKLRLYAATQTPASSTGRHGSRDAPARRACFAGRDLAGEIEALGRRAGAVWLLTPDYGPAGWLAFYLPKGPCVVQPTQRLRWVGCTTQVPFGR